MPHQNTVLDHLFEELASVSEHYMITGRKDRTIRITAWVTADHTGDDVRTFTPGLHSASRLAHSYIEASGPESDRAGVLDELLGKIAAAAPQSQQVPA